MLKRNFDGLRSDPIGKIISAAQGITVSHGPNLPGAYLSGHAAIYVGGDEIAEAHGPGVTTTKLEKVKHVRYTIYRPVHPEVAERAAGYAVQLTQRRLQGLGKKFLDGNYALGSGGAAGSLFSSRHMGAKGYCLIDHVYRFLSDPAAKLAVPNFFCSMFVYTVYEIAQGENRFFYDPYSVDPKFYHKLLHSRQDLYAKVGKYIHVHSEEKKRKECFESVSTALVNYETIRQKQSFKFFRSRSDATNNAINKLTDLLNRIDPTDNDMEPEAAQLNEEALDHLIIASLYYTRSLSELPKILPEANLSPEIAAALFPSDFGAPLDSNSTLLKEFDKTSFFRRLRSVRNS
jgi:hypothetical protein